MQDTAIFQSLLVVPFTALFGEALHDVEYWVLEIDADYFHAEQPNLFGVQVIRLWFGEVSLAITWGGEKLLRSEAIHYHIQALGAEPEKVLGPTWAKDLRCIPALSAAPWHEVIGEPLSGVEIIGFSDTPQAIRLLFPQASLVMSTGCSGDDIIVVGDGDELFIFSDTDWGQLKYKDNWNRLWLTSTASHTEVLLGVSE